MRSPLYSTLLLVAVFFNSASLAAGSAVDCNAIKAKAAEINPDPDVQIAPADSRLWVPRAYIRSYRLLAAQPTLISSARLTAHLPEFSPVRAEKDPVTFGKGWGDTATIFIFQTGSSKTASQLLNSFSEEPSIRTRPSDSLGYNVFLLQYGLVTATELHVSIDKGRFFLCSVDPKAPYNYCTTIVNMVPNISIEITFSVNHLKNFPIVFDGLSKFISCLMRH